MKLRAPCARFVASSAATLILGCGGAQGEKPELNSRGSDSEETTNEMAPNGYSSAGNAAEPRAPANDDSQTDSSTTDGADAEQLPWGRETNANGNSGGGAAGTGGSEGSGATCSRLGDWCIGELLYEDDFEHASSMNNWLAVFNDTSNSSVEVSNGALEITAGAGTTVWFTPELEGNLLIEYDVTMIDDGGPYDRVSDLNQYWMASDTDKPEWLGDLHDGLVRYYVGMGGNGNSTTRFRKMTAVGNEVVDSLLGEYTDDAHLLSGAGPYHIEIVGFDGLVQFRVNGEVFFHYEDPEPHTQGRFGLRTVRNHETVDNFQVHRLNQAQ